MATQYYYKSRTRESGPVSFGELVEMVRRGLITDRDKVRGAWEEEWHWADTVPGLFHMAQRVPTASASEPAHDADAQMAAVADDAAAPESAAVEEVVVRPGWLQRLLLFRTGLQEREGRGAPRRGTRGAAVAADRGITGDAPAFAEEAAEGAQVAAFVNGGGPVGEAEPLIGSGSSAWSAALAAAVKHVDARRAGGSRASRNGLLRPAQGILRLLASAGSPHVLRQGFRWGAAIICANVAAWWVDSWSAREALRFPGRASQGVQPSFPLFGECDPSLYWMLVLHSMVLVGVVAYFAASWLESRAEDS